MKQSMHSETDHEIVNAAANSTALISQILGSAFANDPIMNWITPDNRLYSSMFYAEANALYKDRGITQINQSRCGAALWLPPGVPARAPVRWATLTMLWKLFTSGGLDSLRRATLLEELFEAHHITEPHYYLFAIGAKSEHQGKGIGSALLRTGLELVDAAGAIAYLESSNSKNNALYERFGFEIINEIKLPNNGPLFWPMRRKAR